MDSVAVLMQMNKEIEAAKNKRARLEGELDNIVAQLKEFGVSSIEEAQALVEKMDTEEQELAQKLEGQVEVLMSAYPWVGI